MSTQRVLQTRGDPLGTVRTFLQALWAEAGLDGMLVPVRIPGTTRVPPLLADHPAQLAAADPFAPVMQRNVASDAARLAKGEAAKRLAAVLHPCELRAFAELAKRTPVDRERLLTIGVDCMATYSLEEYQERASSVSDAEQVTREALKFARQGGVVLYRNRPACQMCLLPVAEAADVRLGVLGLPTSEYILVAAQDQAMVDALGLERITDGEAPPTLVASHEKMATTLSMRRGRTRERMTRTVKGVPTNLAELVIHLNQCAPCEECLKACALYNGELGDRSGSYPEAVGRVGLWVAACAGCGMCEEACPKHLPLAAMMGRIRSDLRTTLGDASGGSHVGPSLCLV